MADLGWTINTEELPDAQVIDYAPIPAGKYTAIITNSRLLPTKNTLKQMQGAGVEEYETWRKSNPQAEGYLALDFEVQDTSAQGKKLFHNLNLINDSQQAAEIAAGQLKQILQAFGIKSFDGKTEHLHNKRISLDIVIDPAKPKDKTKPDGEKYPPSNRIKSFSAVGVATTAPQAATASVAKGPWAR